MSEACAAIEVNGETLLGDPTGAAYWPARATLLVADLHFEKGSAYAARGQMLPPYDTRSTLGSLRDAIARHGPDKVIALGDSFHDGTAGERIAERDLAAIQEMTQATEWIWLTGNHDEVLPRGIGGNIAAELALGPLTLRHEPRSGAAPGEIAGHLHPAAVVRTRSRHLRRRCFVSDGQRMVMPSFGAYTGGLDIADAAFAGLFAHPPTAFVLGRDRVYAIPPKRIAGVA